MDATPRLKLDLRAQADDKGLKTEFGGSAMDSLRRLGVDAVDTAVVETQVSEHMEKAAEIRRIEHDIVKLSKRVEHLKVYIKQHTKDPLFRPQAKKASAELLQLLDRKDEMKQAIEDIIQSKTHTAPLSKQEAPQIPTITSTWTVEQEPPSKSEREALGGKRKRKRVYDDSIYASVDDYDDFIYECRLAVFEERADSKDHVQDDWVSIWGKADDTEVQLNQGFALPSCIYEKLMSHQQVGIQWLWELHKQSVGGLLGDEMGLGKTVQIASFFAGLHASGKWTRPSLVICPATVLWQWISEFRKWYPPLRVLIMHDVGNHPEVPNRKLVEKAYREKCVLITTYSSVRLYRDLFLLKDWSYAILDEGHQIKNPDTEITLVAKQLRTYHRIILTGSPIQNRLRELWSLFDFIFPGKLGTLPIFEEQFCLPITQGGYSNASAYQVKAGYKCACLLRDMINPHILRRRKVDVQIDLPKKSEQILFCNLTPFQRALYQRYLESEDVEFVLSQRRDIARNIAFRAISILRKICNHPDLLQHVRDIDLDDAGDRGNVIECCGKMVVLREVLAMWKKQGHRVLIFTQTRQMLDLLEEFTIACRYTYRRMDGTTSVKTRSVLMKEYNHDDSVFLFLLTTRTGGLGVNLTGADRVLIYDPDWNPSTDDQARERSHRIGQTRDVVIYRLITRGTIEEKVYQRQVYKKFLSNKVLNDPSQKRFFCPEDMRDLFSLSLESSTSEVFEQVDTGASKEDQAVSGKEQEVLSLMLASGDLKAAFNHDVLEETSTRKDQEAKEKAAQVVGHALKSLERSRQSLLSAPMGTVSWTGRQGASGGGRFGKISKAQSSLLSSESLLSKLRTADQDADHAADDLHTQRLQELRHILLNFRSTGGITSESLAKRFSDHLRSPQDRAFFKKALREIATKSTRDKKVYWVIKDEFV